MTTTTTTVRLGGGRGRWWMVGAVIVAAGAVVAGNLGRGGEPGAGPASSSSSTAPTSTSLVEGAPLLGRPTGWHLVLPGGDGAPTTRVLDLDTGEVTTVRGPVVGPPRPDGVFTRGVDGVVVWRPFPFDRATVVELASADVVFSSPASDLAWLIGPAPLPARLVTLAGGSVEAAAVVRSIDLPPETTAIGATRHGLVVEGAGDAFVHRGAGFEELADGQPLGVLGAEEVLVQRCDAGLACEIVAVAVAVGLGDERRVPGLETGVLDVVGPTHPDGRLVVATGAGVVLVGSGPPQPVLPEASDLLALGAWSPDGALLFVPDVDAIRVVDPFAAGGPRELTSIRVRGVGSGQLAVVQPRSED